MYTYSVNTEYWMNDTVQLVSLETGFKSILAH